jgi:hypothetical protein
VGRVRHVEVRHAQVVVGLGERQVLGLRAGGMVGVVPGEDRDGYGAVDGAREGIVRLDAPAPIRQAGGDCLRPACTIALSAVISSADSSRSSNSVAPHGRI